MSIMGSSSFKFALDPINRISEVLFGLIMVLTFTGSLSVADAGRSDVRDMLIGALGCNIAWGVIDAFLYLMGCMADRGHSYMAYEAIRKSDDPSQAQKLIADELPPLIANQIQAAELESIRLKLIALPEPPPRAGLQWDDWRGAIGVFFLVFLSTFPVTVPFMLIDDIGPALRVSNAVAVTLLLIAGCAFGRITGRSPVWFGLAMVVLGAAMVAIAIALGG